MIPLCLASYARLLAAGTGKGKQLSKILDTILTSLCPSDYIDNYYDPDPSALNFQYQPDNSPPGETRSFSSGQYSNYSLGKHSVAPEIIRMSQTKDSAEIKRFFENKIIPMIPEERRKLVVAALQDLFRQNSGIISDHSFGKLHPISIREFCSSKNFVLSEVLVDTFQFILENTENKRDSIDELNDLKAIEATYLENFRDQITRIVLYDKDDFRPELTVPLQSTTNSFKRTFFKIHEQNIQVNGTNDLQVFLIDLTADGDFDYYKFWNLIRKNIGYYVYSRKEIDERDEEDLPLLSSDAKRFLKSRLSSGTISGDNELENIMFFMFVEQILQAPKLLSSIEIKAFTGDVKARSVGAHLLTGSDRDSQSQLIFGASVIKENIYEAIDSAVKQIKEVNKNKANERTLVSKSIFNHKFNQQEAANISEIIIPTRGLNTCQATIAYSIFLGYTIENEYIFWPGIRSELSKKETEYVLNTIPYLEKRLEDEKLNNFSFYVYFVPLEDAERDKKEFFERID